MEPKIHKSPSGKYTLEVSSKETKPGCWNYTTGVVKLRDRMVLAEVNCNYHQFPFLFVEDHPNGHDYLVCSENYQGQTVIDLCCAERRDFLPDSAKKGFGFCWASYEFNVEQQMLIVDGCIWACPYEYRFYDFSDPMEGWPEIKSGTRIDAENKKPTINPDGTIVCYDVRTEDDDEDDDDEDDDDEDDDDEPEGYVVATKTFKREGLTLTLVDEWVDEAEKVRREEWALRQKEWKAAWQLYKETSPLYLRVEERVESSEEFNAASYFGIGRCYQGWCPHFDEEDGRVSRRIANRKSVGKDTITLDLEWGREKAPVKLIVYKNGNKLEVKWFDHSVTGIDCALDYALEKLLPPPGVMDRVRAALS